MATTHPERMSDTDSHIAKSSYPSNSRDRGFTLVELLVVIMIIVVLIALVGGGVIMAKQRAKLAEARSEIQSMVLALKQYQSEKNFFPGARVLVDENDLESANQFPLVIKALYHETAFLQDLKRDRFLIKDEDVDPKYPYRPAKNSEVKDKELEKYYADPWSFPYFYRENASKSKKRDFMINERSYDLWSIGPNGKNDSCYGLTDDDEDSDDIGNW